MADAPWGYWRFEEGYAGVGNCNGPTAHNGFPAFDEVTGSPSGDYCPTVSDPNWVTSADPPDRLSGPAIELLNQKLRFGITGSSPPPPPQSSDFTWEFWYKAAPEASDPIQLLQWDHRTTSTREFDVRVNQGALQLRSDQDWGSLQYRTCGTASIDDGAWHQIAVSRSLPNRRVRGYIDGQLACEETIPTGITWQYGGSTYFFFAGPTASVPPDWHYFLDDLSHYQTELTPGRVLAHHSGVDTDADFLAAHAPQIRYDHDETYYANGVGTITDWTGNRLINSVGTTIAERPATPGAGYLSLGWVRSTYQTGAVAMADDRLDENTDYETAGQTFEADPRYRDRAYGRIVEMTDDTLWAQYWLWYYYNERGAPSAGEHEGDWEFAQFHFDASGQLIEGVYDQHGHPQTCPAESMVYSAEGRPILYSAVASHASYFAAGEHDVPDNPFDDRADGLGLVVDPAVIPLESDTSPAWLAWPGSWGGSSGVFSATSPHGPRFEAHETQWNEPGEYAESSDFTCEESSPAAAQRQNTIQERFARASVAAELSGRTVTVRFSYPDGRVPGAAWVVVDPVGPATPVSDIAKIGPDGAGDASFTVSPSASKLSLRVRVSPIGEFGQRGAPSAIQTP